MARSPGAFVALAVGSVACAQGPAVLRPSSSTAEFRHVLVAALMVDIDHRKITERAFVSALRDKGVDAIPSTAIWAPYRQYTPEEKERAVRASGSDAVLTITVGDERETTRYKFTETVMRVDLCLSAAEGNEVTWVGSTRAGGRSFGSLMVVAAGDIVARMRDEGIIVKAKAAAP